MVRVTAHIRVRVRVTAHIRIRVKAGIRANGSSSNSSLGWSKD